MVGVLKPVQRSLFESLLVTYGGDFASAYADLAEQAGDAVISESLAVKWAKDVTERERKAEAGAQLGMVLAGKGLATKAADFAGLDRDKKLSVITDEFLTFAHTIVSDHQHEVFEPRDRVSGIPKVAELLGVPQRLQARQSAPQAAHRAVPREAWTFGRLTDRQVMVMFVQNNESVEFLTHTLRTLDPELSYLTPEWVGEKLRLWRRDGVVMDEAGTVVEWDEAVQALSHQLRTLPAM